VLVNVDFPIDQPYHLLNNEVNGQWTWGRSRAGPEVVEDLRNALAGDPDVYVLVAHGANDLVTPYFASELILDQLPVYGSADRLKLAVYGARAHVLQPPGRASGTVGRSVLGRLQSANPRKRTYLGAVYGLVAVWAAEGREIDRGRQALRLQRLDVSEREDAFAAVIRCTADPAKADKRTRSKWSRLMRYAAMYKTDSERLDQFIQRKGGINECAARFTRRLGRRKATGSGRRSAGE